MTSSDLPKATGVHLGLLDRYVRLCRDTRVSDDDARDLLQVLCSIAFHDGCIATNQLMLRDLALIKAQPDTRMQ